MIECADGDSEEECKKGSQEASRGDDVDDIYCHMYRDRGIVDFNILSQLCHDKCAGTNVGNRISMELRLASQIFYEVVNRGGKGSGVIHVIPLVSIK